MDSAATLAVRVPLLKELVAYKKAKSEAEKEAHRTKLRALFESVGKGNAESFHAMLGKGDALAAMFREVFKNDPLQAELLGILTKKYASQPCAPEAPSAAPQAPATPPDMTLPIVNLSDERPSTRFTPSSIARSTRCVEPASGSPPTI